MIKKHRYIHILVISLFLLCSFNVIAESLPDDTTKSGLHNFIPMKQYSPNVFSDVSTEKWYYGDIKFAYEMDLVNGRGNGLFHPNEFMTVSEAVALASKVNNIYKGNNQTFDADGTEWFDTYLNYALINNIIEVDDFNNYSRNVTRAEMAYILSRVLPEDELNSMDLYYYIPDIADSKYKENIEKLYRAGIMNGVDEKGTFLPSKNIIRAEVAAIMNRIVNKSLRANVIRTLIMQNGAKKIIKVYKDSETNIMTLSIEETVKPTDYVVQSEIYGQPCTVQVDLHMLNNNIVIMISDTNIKMGRPLEFWVYSFDDDLLKKVVPSGYKTFEITGTANDTTFTLDINGFKQSLSKSDKYKDLVNEKISIPYCLPILYEVKDINNDGVDEILIQYATSNNTYNLIVEYYGLDNGELKIIKYDIN